VNSSRAGDKMTAVVMNRRAVPSQVCIACYLILGSAEKAVQGVHGHKEGPLHEHCATPAERRLMMARHQANGDGASANPNQ